MRLFRGCQYGLQGTLENTRLTLDKLEYRIMCQYLKRIDRGCHVDFIRLPLHVLSGKCKEVVFEDAITSILGEDLGAPNVYFQLHELLVVDSFLVRGNYNLLVISFLQLLEPLLSCRKSSF